MTLFLESKKVHSEKRRWNSHPSLAKHENYTRIGEGCEEKLLRIHKEVRRKKSNLLSPLDGKKEMLEKYLCV